MQRGCVFAQVSVVKLQFDFKKNKPWLDFKRKRNKCICSVLDCKHSMIFCKRTYHTIFKEPQYLFLKE